MFDIRKFGANISNLRKSRDMTQSELADKINVSRQAISRYETGESFPEISILAELAEFFSQPIDTLINAGGATKTESSILKTDSDKVEFNGIIDKTNADEILNIAPYLKPSVLDKVAKSFGKHDIDISKLVDLAEYMNEESFLELIDNANFDAMNREVLEKFLPFLNEQSRGKIFEKIIEGELDYHYLEIILPYAEYLIQHIEAAVVYGVLNEDSLRIVSEYIKSR